MASPQVVEAIAKNESARVLLSFLAKDVNFSMNSFTVVATTIMLILIIGKFLSPSLDSREPPLLKPMFPLVGHIFGIMWHQAMYHVILRRKTRQPIVTLQMLTGKMYAIWDPALITAGLRNKNLSTTPQVMAVTQGLTQTRDETFEIIRGHYDGELFAEYMMRHVIPQSLSGSHLHSMNQVALEQLAIDLSDIESEKVSNLWLWLRHMLTVPTSKALFGNGDPFARNPGLEDVLWTFESNLPKLIANFLPSIVTPAGHRAREVLSEALGQYYAGGHDRHPSVSEFVRSRARTMRDCGIADDEIGRIETMLPFASMVNTVPSLFWFFSFVFSNKELAKRLREEAESLAARDGDEVTIALEALEERVPLLLSCYRETLRLSVHQVNTRTVIEDTVLSDGKGRSYLLKKDTVVQMSAGVSHSIEDIWGPDVDKFDPDRFLNFGKRSVNQRSDGFGNQKDMRVAFLPFGDGMHYCPGRNFAYAEMMAIMLTMVLGFEIDSLEGEWKLPGWATWSLIDAVSKPAGQRDGVGIRIKRRENWEGVKFKFKM